MADMLDRNLISRGFKFQVIVYRARPAYRFTTADYKRSVELAISTLPEDLIIKEVVLKTETTKISGEETELMTIIYWN